MRGALSKEQIKAIADRAERRSSGSPKTSVPSVGAAKPASQSKTISECTNNLRKIIGDAEQADRPYARHPLIQQIKEFTNIVDAMVEQEKQLKK